MKNQCEAITENGHRCKRHWRRNYCRALCRQPAEIIKRRVLKRVKMRKLLGNRLYTKISGAVKTSGTFDPDENMYIIEEDMTCGEYNLVRAFLAWLHDNNKTIGSGNYEQRFTEFAEYTGSLKYK